MKILVILAYCISAYAVCASPEVDALECTNKFVVDEPLRRTAPLSKEVEDAHPQDLHKALVGDETKKTLIFEEGAKDLCAQKDALVQGATGGWCSRLWGGLKNWWYGASWQERIVCGVFGGVCVGFVARAGTNYFVFHNMKDFYAYFGWAPSPKDVITTTQSLVLTPTPSQVAQSILISAAGATVSAFPTPKPSPQKPHLCRAKNTHMFTSDSCLGPQARFNGKCLPVNRCTRNGHMLYQSDEGSCLCPRICNDPPRPTRCTYHVATDSTGAVFGEHRYVFENIREDCWVACDPPKRSEPTCDHIPMCDGDCLPAWCQACGSWDDPILPSEDPLPTSSDIFSWFHQNGIDTPFWIRRACASDHWEVVH